LNPDCEEDVDADYFAHLVSKGYIPRATEDGVSMGKANRQKAVKNFVRKSNLPHAEIVKRIVKLFNVNERTVWRDIEELEKD